MNTNIKHPETPLFEPSSHEDIKDPCPVWDGRIWHIFGSAGSSTKEVWQILHAVAPRLDSPWKEVEPAVLKGVKGDHVAAPGIIYDSEEKLFHMFVQTDFMSLGGTIQHLVSYDGHVFDAQGISLDSAPQLKQAGIYDPHPAEINGIKCLTYSGTEEVGRPDIYLAQSTSNSWNGPWKRTGVILYHEEVEHHNQRDQHDYEWGLEGSQLVQLPNGLILLNAVCFLPEGIWGTRQRVFFAVSRKLEGPYKTLGPILLPAKVGWASGENGHAAAVIVDDLLHLFYQARPFTNQTNNWRYGHATFSLEEVMQQAEQVL